MSYTLVTGNTLYPSQTPYQNITLTGNITLNWPSSFTGGISTAYFTVVTPNANGHNITLPDTTLAAPGNHLIFYNSSAYSFNILKNDGSSLLTIGSGQSIDIVLNDNTTAAGGWITLPYGSGISNISNLIIHSSDSSIIVTNGNVIPPGGTINLQLPTSISNINSINTTGLPVILGTDPLTWTTVTLVGGNNITINNANGTAGNPVINVNNNLTGLTSMAVGSFTLTGSTLSASTSDIDLKFLTLGTGVFNFNNATIDVGGNIIAPSISTDKFNSPSTPVMWCFFTDTSGTIVIEDGYNIATIVRNSSTYLITFANALGNINYGVLVTTGTNGLTLPTVIHGYPIQSTRSTTSVEVVFVDASGEVLNDLPYGATITIMSTSNSP